MGIIDDLLRDVPLPPVVMQTDRLAIQLAVKTCNVPDVSRVRLVRVPNTLHLEHIEISEGLREEASRHPNIRLESECYDWTFDAQGHLETLGH